MAGSAAPDAPRGVAQATAKDRISATRLFNASATSQLAWKELRIAVIDFALYGPHPSTLFRT
eukprot:scaffold442_cov268-Pinguiococcus_pyrenoidosus.AAC.24